MKMDKRVPVTTSKHTYTQICTHIHMRICYVCVCVCVCVRACMSVIVCVYVRHAYIAQMSARNLKMNGDPK